MVTTDDGGRVTLAVLSQKLDDIIRRLEQFERCQAEQDRRMAALEQAAARREERINNLAQDVSRLESRDTFGSVTSSILAVIAGFIGWFK